MHIIISMCCCMSTVNELITLSCIELPDSYLEVALLPWYDIAYGLILFQVYYFNLLYLEKTIM